MRNKFSIALILAVIALSGLSVYAQSDWERIEREAEKQARKAEKDARNRTTVRTIRGQNGVIITSSDEVIVRPALRANVRPVVVRPVVVRPVAPRPPLPSVRANVRIYSNNSYRKAPGYSYRSYDDGDYEFSRNFESNRFGSIDQIARLNGYRDGQREGATDARDGDAYNPFGEHFYRDGATGYISKYGNREGYKQLYRQSFIRGYKESFDRYLGGYERRY